ncbi:hypothetical protein V5O48_009747 [Marasmius crinis-equi]|uniref:MAGE domain-containing protein n=1 Tax=Marasmius crinis-equi TaxID=585013 RepID=A0ABR3FAN2_9AGAR
MAPRAATRSQRQSQAASQSQNQPSQRQRAVRGRIESDDEEEAPQPTQDGDDNGMMDVDENDSGDSEVTRKANQLVRLAMFTEHRKVPLRREEITKKVLGTNSRIFNRVLETANRILNKTFGMELVELPSKAYLEEDAAPAAAEQVAEEGKKAGGKKKASSSGSKSYILRSTLHPGLIEYSALMQDKILEEELADAPSDSDDEHTGVQSYGSILSWSTSDQLEAVGILHIILSLVLVSGRVLGDGDLRKHLKRLHLTNNSEVRLSALSVQRTMPFDRFLDLLMRQGYLDQRAIGEGKKKGGPGKRARTTGADDDSGLQYEWRWGPRAHSEIGERGLAEYMAELMVAEEQEDEDAEEGQGSSRGAQRKRRETVMSSLEKMKDGIEKAAGGNLSDLK